MSSIINVGHYPTSKHQLGMTQSQFNIHSEALFVFFVNPIPLNLLRSLSPYVILLIAEIIHPISYIIYCSTLNEIFIEYSYLKKNYSWPI